MSDNDEVTWLRQQLRLEREQRAAWQQQVLRAALPTVQTAAPILHLTGDAADGFRLNWIDQQLREHGEITLGWYGALPDWVPSLPETYWCTHDDQPTASTLREAIDYRIKHP